MAQQAQVKNYWTFVKGLVTEAGPLTFPENSALSLDNVVLNVDGSIEPRHGFSNSRIAYTTSSSDTAYERDVTTYMWLSAGGAEAEDLFVIKAGSVLRFYKATEPEPLELAGQDIDLSTFLPSGSPYTSSDIEASGASMAVGDGRLYVVTPYTEPVILEYNATSQTIGATELQIKERDLEGVDDGTEPDFHPSTLTTQHNYNLSNAGWNESKINSYRNSYGEYPSRSEDPWTGLVEEVNPETGSVTTRFRPSQYRALGDVGFGTSEASKGHYVLDTFNTTVVTTSDNSTSNSRIRIQFVNPVQGASPNDDQVVDYDGVNVTVETVLNIVQDGDDVNVAATSADIRFEVEGTFYYYPVDLINGNWTADVSTSNQFTFYMTKAQVEAKGAQAAYDFTWGETYAYDSETYPYSTSEGVTTVQETSSTIGTIENKRFEAVAFYAGRVFYAGVQPDSRSELNGRIYYSQIIRTRSNANKCYQSNDPSAKDVNDLLDSDGGYITINDLGVVHAMVPFRTSLIVITTNGAWEIGAGDSYFTPSSYVVRRLSDRGSRFRRGVTTIDSRPSYWSTQGLELIRESEITGFPERQSLTDETIKSFVQRDVVPRSVSATYDNVDNKAYWVFQFESTTEATVLCFDTRLGAFYPWTIELDEVYIRGIQHFDSGPVGRLRLITQEQPFANTWRLNFAAPNLTNNTDYLVNENLFEASIEAGNELLGDAMRTKQAIKVASFFERNDNASCYAQGRYDWASSGVSGKWNNNQQAYRDPGEGFDVARSRLRMRGSGPSFRVRYKSDGNHPFKLYGWSVLYTGADRV